tara:strand:+ start:3075 stop:3653 length:579 start_codon:yes stop_codon:yes gene_type:complete
MQNVFNKHGRFEPEPLQEIEGLDEMTQAEAEWLAKNVGQPGCVNLSSSATNNNYMSPEARAKSSKSLRGKKYNLSEAERKRRSVASACLRTPEALAKMRESLTGRILSDEHRKSIAEGNRGKKRPWVSAGITALNKARAGRVMPTSQRDALSAHFSSTVWVCHPTERSRRIQEEDLHQLEHEGWRRGRRWRA